MNVAFSHIGKTFGSLAANDDISLTLAPGRIHGLVGENGAGKSTLMRILCGAVTPDAGNLVVDGRTYAGLTPSQAGALGIGMLPQDPLDFPNLPVWENFALGGGPILRRREAVPRLAAACRRLRLDLPPDVPVSRLGVGERQQLELARLLDRRVRLLILDEPTTGIAPAQKDALFTLLRRFVADGDNLAVLVTHKLAEAEAVCDTVLVLRRGRLAGRFRTPLARPAILAAMFGEEAAADMAPPSSSRVRSPIAGATPRLRLEGAVFADDSARLAPLDFEANPGEILGLAGVAGSGQTLCLDGLAGLARTVAGRLLVDGRDLAGRDLARFLAAGIRSLPAARLEQGLFPHLAARDHLRLAFPGKPADVDGLFASRCLGTFRLTDAPNATAASLSGGNQQRLLLSLVPDDTRLLLADNPTRGLDAASVAQVWALFRDRADRGATIVFASEDLDELRTRADRILFFFNRRLVADLDRDIDPGGQGLGERLTGLATGSGEIRP